MSKYTEAEQFFKKHDHDGCLENCMEDADLSCDYCDKQRETICEALEIADRLEQADARENVGKCLGEMEEWERLTTNEDSYFKGYNQALADIRGDNNG